jgi:hypothetical protein
MGILFLVLTTLFAFAGAAIFNVSKSAVHEILAALLFLGALGSLATFAIHSAITRLTKVVAKDDTREGGRY